MGINNKFRITNFEFRICIILLLVQFILPFQKTQAQTIHVGVALPLFEDSDDPVKKQLGSEILDGIRFAVGDFNKTNAYQIRLDIKDTKRDLAECTSIIKDFGDDSAIACVLGPIFSTELAQVSELGEL